MGEGEGAEAGADGGETALAGRREVSPEGEVMENGGFGGGDVGWGAVGIGGAEDGDEAVDKGGVAGGGEAEDARGVFTF